jgi:hypothetical protein
MRVYEFGDNRKPVLMLLPGTFCYWKANFGHVLNMLQEKFYTVCVSYDGFDETDNMGFESMLQQTDTLERYIQEYFDKKIFAMYGSSLGGSFVSLLVSRQRVKINYAIIGSSDFDQAGKLEASLKTRFFIHLLYPLFHDGQLKNHFLNKRLEKRMKESDEYVRAFKSLLGNMSFVTKRSMENLFYSDLITPVPKHIDISGTEVHILYASKMGKKYLKRYQEHFSCPIIHEQALRHEELLAVYPKEWVDLIEKICGF